MSFGVISQHAICHSTAKLYNSRVLSPVTSNYMQTHLNSLPRVSSRRKVDTEGDNSDASEAATVVRRPKKGPVYQYSAHEDTAILRAFARSAVCPDPVPVCLPSLASCPRPLVLNLLCDPCFTAGPSPPASPLSVSTPPRSNPSQLQPNPLALPSRAGAPLPLQYLKRPCKRLILPACSCAVLYAAGNKRCSLAVPVGLSVAPQHGRPLGKPALGLLQIPPLMAHVSTTTFPLIGHNDAAWILCRWRTHRSPEYFVNFRRFELPVSLESAKRRCYKALSNYSQTRPHMENLQELCIDVYQRHHARKLAAWCATYL